MNKFQRIVGKFFLQLLGFVAVIFLTSVIVISYYEAEKEHLFFEFSNYLEAFEESVVDKHEMFDAKDLVVDEVTHI